jgi:hypothetical protein
MFLQIQNKDPILLNRRRNFNENAIWNFRARESIQIQNGL